MNDTHYLPAFTEHNGQKQRAVCGVWIRRDAHTAEPSCTDCRQWLEADAAEAAKFDTVEAQADALFGSAEEQRHAGVAEPLRSFGPRFSATDGYRPKGAR